MNDENYLLPQGMKLPELMRDNKDCISIALAWILSEDIIENDALWLANECAYFGIKKEQAVSAAVSGFSGLLKSLQGVSEAYQQEQLTELIRVYNMLLLRRLDPDISDADRAKAQALSTLRVMAEGFVVDVNEVEYLTHHYLENYMPKDWLDRMSHAQVNMFAEMTEESGIAVENIYNELFTSLLPEDMQSAPVIEKLIVYTASALTKKDPDNCIIWEQTAQSFIDTIQTTD